ncbi:hypothetical protein SARC_11367, partial [Sphaeroforma arctica JP610]
LREEMMYSEDTHNEDESDTPTLAPAPVPESDGQSASVSVTNGADGAMAQPPLNGSGPSEDNKSVTLAAQKRTESALNDENGWGAGEAEGMQLVQRVMVTPLRTVPIPAEHDATNRIFRAYSAHRHRFLRVSFVDEYFHSIMGQGCLL